MGSILRNPRHELYAQGRAAGLTRAEAYTKAGFKCKNPATAGTQLEGTPHIQKRLEELLKNGAARSELSRRDILDRIYDDWNTARQLGQMASALKAAELIGKESHHMFTERKEIGGPGDFDNKSEDELRAILKEGLEDLGWDTATTPEIPPDQLN